jgi:hypothetical protein
LPLSIVLVSEIFYKEHFYPIKTCGNLSFCLLQAFLENEDLGNSVGSVEVLLQKHDDFEEAFTAQEEKIIVRKRPWLGICLLFAYIISFNMHPYRESLTSVTIRRA